MENEIDKNIKSAVHALVCGMHVDEIITLTMLFDNVKRIVKEEKKNKMETFFHLVKEKIESGEIRTKRIEEVEAIKNDYFKKYLPHRND